MHTKALLFWLAFATTVFCVTSFRAIPEDKLMNFLEYNVRLGYKLVEGGQKLGFRSAISSDTMAVSVYQWAIENRKVDSGLQGKGIICFPNKQCVNIGDPGVHP
ncbi:hypothetical protein FQR65_LT16212 [Abscondita terminalis]|nr:hypothetical protein FQR65_LT16212 [Abscondita terminalis]